MTPSPTPDFSRRLVEVLAVGVAYFVLGRLALLLAIPPGYATAVWPAAGVALAAVLMLGRHVWPGIAVGSFVVNVWTSFDAASLNTIFKTTSLPLFIGIGAALQALVGAQLIRRFVGYPNPLAKEQDVIKFLMLGGPVACLVNAAWGATILWFTGTISSAVFLFSWWTWWVGDTIGSLTFSPLALIWLAEPREAWRRRRLSVTRPLALTFGLAVVLFVYASRWEQNRLRLEFQRRTDAVAQELIRQVNRHIDALHSLESYYVSSGQITREAFRTFVQRVLSRHGGIRVFAWTPRVLDTDRAQFEAGVRREGLANFEITEENSAGEMQSAGQRAEYLPITYIEPFGGSVAGHRVAQGPRRTLYLCQPAFR